MSLLILATVTSPLQVAESRASDEPEVLCAVTDEQIVAATLRQPVTLDTRRCTSSLKFMVETTLEEVHKNYAPFYTQTHLNPSAAAEVSMLLVRRQLLSGSWSANHVEHYTISEDPALLDEIDRRLHEYLTPQQLASLKDYEGTIPARTLLEPVVSRLAKYSRPMSELQYQEAVKNVTPFFADRLQRFQNAPKTEATDPLQRCRDSHARINARDEGLRAIVSRSLDEEQQLIAEGYYRDLFDRRARSLQRYEDAHESGNAFCTYDPF
jgi:hypothetical protein